MEHQEDEVNPYRAPETVAAQPPSSPPGQLASRWARLGGAIIDGVVITVVGLPVEYAMGVYDNFPDISEPTSQVGLLSLSFSCVLFLVLNGYLMATRGQTIGKSLLRMRMVRTNGKAATFGRLMWLRYLPQWVVVLIPILGPYLAFVDPLFIFRRDKRCVHDLIAGTMVVRATSRS